MQWWWNRPRSTDDLPQLFWFDGQGRPEAAVIITDFADGSSAVYEEPIVVVIVMPDTTPDWVAHVVECGLAHAGASGIGALELEVGRSDAVLREVLFGHGFTVKEEGLVESWLRADARPEISPLLAGYRLASRAETIQRPHHMVSRSGPDVEQRLWQTSLYRADLDLTILDSDDNSVASGLFWFDPEVATGVVEPMRTEDDHQRRGFARNVLTTGIDLLAKAGAERIKICFDLDNIPASRLYLSVGFEPANQTDVFARAALSTA